MSEERKHLFGSTEKSDFIVNMTEKQYQKMGLLYMGLVAVVMILLTIPYYLSKGAIVIFNNGLLKYADQSSANASSSSYISYLQIALFAMGFFGFLVLLVSVTKKYFKARENCEFLLIAVFAVFLVVSTLLAYNIKTAFFGRDYRYHGLLTYLSYIGLFAAASQSNCRDRRKNFLDLFMIIAFINAVYGLLQIVPSFVEKLPNFFYEMFQPAGDPAFAYERFIADGLVHTPHALAALMTMAFAIGGAGFIHEENKTRRTLYGIASLVFVAAAVATTTLAGYVGIITVSIVLIIAELIRIAKGTAPKRAKMFERAIVRTITIVILGGAVVGIMASFDRVHLYDGHIIYTDATARIGASFPNTDSKGGFAYPELWHEGVTMLKEDWVFGTGPDCIGNEHYGYADLYNSAQELTFSTDRTYNEYLDMALACGIPCLLVYLALGFITVKKGTRAVGSFFKREDSWTALALLAAVIGYAVQANVNISIITVTPYFFLFVGLLWNKPHDVQDTKSKNRKQIKN